MAAMAQIRDIAPSGRRRTAAIMPMPPGGRLRHWFHRRFKGAVIPNVVGVDIGCGVLLPPLEV